MWCWRWKLVPPGTFLKTIEGMRFCCFVVGCLFVCLFVSFEEEDEAMKASFPRHMSGGGPGLARVGPGVLLLGQRRPANTRQPQHQLKPANSPKRSSYLIFFGQSAAWCEASIFISQHDNVLNWNLLSMHYGEVEKNSWKWSTLGAYFSAVFCRKYVKSCSMLY